ncbi:MAG: cysteine desulfurase [Candidatus Hydrothermae bacterium]|nr:cysteine desulfurase [Candidatus Hydrothermae bacterium]
MSGYPEVLSIREDFPILKRKIEGHPLVYLDNAATTQKPRQVIDTVRRFYEFHNANIHRGKHTLSEEASELYEDVKKKTASFINAKSWREIVFTRNATEAINLVAYSYGTEFLKEGDEILLTMMEHHANIVPWQMLQEKKGVKLRFINIDSNSLLRMEEFEEKLSERTKLVSVAHVSNVLGTVNPVREIAKMAHRVGALILVDAAQSAPHLPLNVREIDADFMVFSSHKMLEPTGIGVLYGKEEILEKMPPFLRGGDMIKRVKPYKSYFKEVPWKFEAGTPDICGTIGFGAAIDYLKKTGMEKIEAWDRHLVGMAYKLLSEIPALKIIGPEDRVGALSFLLGDLETERIALFLNSYGISIREGCHCAQPLHRSLGLWGTARASFYIYNTEEEVLKLRDALLELAKIEGISE